jgi:hypothetical protein
MYHRYLFLCGLLVVAGCGDDAPASESTATGGATTNSTNGGSPAATQGGSTNVSGGLTASGGTSAVQGGAKASGGAAAQGGSTVVAGNPCTANCPTGTIDLCFSVGCPLGACDNSLFQAGTLCSTNYPTAIDANTTFCAQGQTGSYCLGTIDRILRYAVVRCVNGTPTIESCTGGCGVDSDGAASC